MLGSTPQHKKRVVWKPRPAMRPDRYVKERVPFSKHQYCIIYSSFLATANIIPLHNYIETALNRISTTAHNHTTRLSRVKKKNYFQKSSPRAISSAAVLTTTCVKAALDNSSSGSSLHRKMRSRTRTSHPILQPLPSLSACSGRERPCIKYTGEKTNLCFPGQSYQIRHFMFSPFTYRGRIFVQQYRQNGNFFKEPFLTSRFVCFTARTRPSTAPTEARL